MVYLLLSKLARELFEWEAPSEQYESHELEQGKNINIKGRIQGLIPGSAGLLMKRTASSQPCKHHLQRGLLLCRNLLFFSNLRLFPGQCRS